LKRVCWPLNIKLSRIEKYDGSTNPANWLKVYQLNIEAASGDSYFMAHYLPICLSSSTRTWLLRLPVGPVHSWNHLCRLFTSNFHAMCACLGVNWDLANVVQTKGESLREFIQSFFNKRNIILEIDGKSIVMFFMKGLRDPALIRMLAMKNSRTSESMFAIANKYDLSEEATLDTREQKKEKDSGHVGQPSSSKGHNKKRRVDHSINTLEQPRHNKEYWPRPCEFECFQNCICIFHPQGKHKTRNYD
jgi:hypothetical protein